VAGSSPSGLPAVAVVGLGKMGAAIAERVLAAEYPLIVYNRTPERAASLLERGATLIESPRDALREADLCVTMVTDDAALAATAAGADGVLAGARPGTTLIDMSTISVAGSKAVAGAAADAGVHYLRAPVSGNPGVVRAGNLTIIVSGPDGPFRAAEPLLRTIGPTVFHVGGAEEARVVKLALQVLIAGTVELMGEALVLAEGQGVDRAKLLEVMGASAIGSPFVRYKTEPLLREDYSATFTTAMMLKDIDLVLALVESAGTLPLTEVLRTLLAETAAASYADSDLMALYLHLRNRRAR
jgi:3-hydroxyisobutyrate dehydrogenase-like beta-hydroxyacid dehydrogenase